MKCVLWQIFWEKRLHGLTASSTEEEKFKSLDLPLVIQCKWQQSTLVFLSHIFYLSCARHWEDYSRRIYHFVVLLVPRLLTPTVLEFAGGFDFNSKWIITAL